MKKLNVLIVMAALVFSAMVPFAAADTASDDVPYMVYGTSSLVVDLDPQYSWDSASNDMIEQIVEGLFTYNLSDPNLAYIPCLAADYGTWAEGVDGFHGKQWTYTVDLVTGVTFHDDTTFGSEDVVYSFDRLTALCTDGVDEIPTQVLSLYAPLASSYPATPLLINKTEAIDADTVKITLNYKYVAFEPLLCYVSSAILPEDEYPMDEYLDKSSDVLIGTGPYMQISNTATLTEFAYFPDFRGAYGKGAPEIRKMVYKLYTDATVLNQAFLAGDVDAIGGISIEFMTQYENSTLHVVGDRMAGTSIAYIGYDMNNVDLHTRKACLKAINYTYTIDVLRKGESAQLNSLVPAGILYHDWDAPTPTMDLEEARAQIILAVDNDEQGCVEPAGWTALKISDDDADWEAVSIVSIDYAYNIGNQFREDFAAMCQSDFAKVGITLEVHGLEWSAYLDALDGGTLEMYNLGWGPDFNDPSNYVDSLAGSASQSNSAHVNDTVLDGLIAEGLLETNPALREALYIEMQQRVNEIGVFGYLFTPNGRSVYNKGCTNTARNAMGKLYWYLWDFDPTFNAANRVEINFGIPSFDIVALIGVCAISLSAIIYKKRH